MYVAIAETLKSEGYRGLTELICMAKLYISYGKVMGHGRAHTHMSYSKAT